MATKFNASNTGHLTGNYPLFLGPDLGAIDTINIAYPKLDKLWHEQVSQIWNEHEVDLNADKMDMINLPKDTVDLMVKTISWQHVADSVASRSIVNTLGRYITNSEYQNAINAQQFFESIHARAYSHIIKQTFVDPNESLTELYKDASVLRRSDIIVKTFDDMENNDLERDGLLQTQKQILKTITALFALEAVAFMSSFAVTFAITETDVFQGIGTLVELICRDEVSHTKLDYAVADILIKDPSWSAAFEEARPEMKLILDDVIRQELEWAEYLFSEGRQVIGLNASLLQDYTLFLARPLYNVFKIPYDFKEVKTTPLPYMTKHIDPSSIQTAAQELQLKSYNIGAIEDDTDGLDLDLEF